jgi:predicted ester cyclase
VAACGQTGQYGRAREREQSPPGSAPREWGTPLIEPSFGGGSTAPRNAGRETSPMPDPHQTVVFRWLAAGDAGDLDAFDELLHSDSIVHAPAGLSTATADEEKAVWKDALAAMPDLRHEVQEVLVDGHVEMARVVVTGTMAAGFAGVGGTGRPFRIDQAVIVHLRDGKVAEAWEIADIAALQAQVSGEAPEAAP